MSTPSKMPPSEVDPPDRATPGTSKLEDHDLDRLETSLRWLQRQEAATRLPRASAQQLRRSLGLPEDGSRRPAVEQPAERPRSPLSLEPQRLALPPPRSGRSFGTPIVIAITGGFTAAIVCYVAVGGWGRPSAPPPPPQVASFDSRAAVPMAPSRSEPRPPVARADDPATAAERELPTRETSSSQSVTATEGGSIPIGAMAMLPPNATAAPDPPPSKVIRALDPEEIEVLIRQGERLVAAGDLVTARTVLRRAAEAGDATAATALAATFDPIVLARLGVLGMDADVEKARTWYQTAERLGSNEASRRLQALASR